VLLCNVRAMGWRTARRDHSWSDTSIQLATAVTAQGGLPLHVFLLECCYIFKGPVCCTGCLAVLKKYHRGCCCVNTPAEQLAAFWA
jgi:hypothetical protein